jgi:hypothetical protein
METQPLSDRFELRHAATDHALRVSVPARRLLAMDGFGPPGTPDFLLALRSLRSAEQSIRARLAAAGITVVYDPQAVVAHRREVTLRSFWDKNVRYGRGARWHRRRHEAGALGPPGLYAGLLRSGFAGGVPLGAAVVCSQIAVFCGYVMESLARN